MNGAAIGQLLLAQLRSSARSFPSVFYTIVLPLVIFAVFGSVFGVNADYAVFFLPGMIGVMTSSDAMFAVGPVIKEYFRQGIVREFNGYPIHIAWLFASFICTRLIFILVSASLLIAMSTFLFGYTPGFEVAARYIGAIVIGFVIYSFLALSISIYGISDNRDQGIISLYYFLGMFLSDAYFVLSGKSPALDAIGYVFPLKVVLKLMRGEAWAILPCMAWLALTGGLFVLVAGRISFKRQ